MNLYFIKDINGEKGPLTIEELRRLKISKTDYVRTSKSGEWFIAESVPDLKFIFKKRFRFLKISGTLICILMFGFIIVMVVKENQASSYSYGSQISTPIPPPPIIDFDPTSHKKKFLKELFKDCNLSGKKKQLVHACNYTNTLVRNTAASIAGQSPGNFNLGQICDVFDYCYNDWKYVNDPIGQEIIEFASNTIGNKLNGDCDDFAVLVCSMILAIGGEARVNYAYGSTGGHAFTEVNIGTVNSDELESYISSRYKDVYNNDGIWSRTDGDNVKWLNLDWFANHPGGKYYDYSYGTTFYILQQFCSDFN